MKLNTVDGFTLSEMLVSLVVFSLSMAVIWQGAGLVSRLNSRVTVQKAEAVAIRGISEDIATKLSPLQPIKDEQVTGQLTHMQFQCEAKAPSQNCSYNAPLGHFIYISEGVRYSTWPPAKAEGMDPPRLTALAVENEAGKSLTVVKFPVEHTADCQFDMISRTCREETAVSEALP